MHRVRFSPEFAQVFDNVDEFDVEVDGRTLREALEAAARAVGGGDVVGDAVFWGGPGESARIAPDMRVLVGDRDVSDVDLDAVMLQDAEVVVTPLKGNARPLQNV